MDRKAHCKRGGPTNHRTPSPTRCGGTYLPRDEFKVVRSFTANLTSHDGTKGAYKHLQSTQITQLLCRFTEPNHLKRIKHIFSTTKRLMQASYNFINKNMDIYIRTSSSPKRKKKLNFIVEMDIQKPFKSIDQKRLALVPCVMGIGMVGPFACLLLVLKFFQGELFGYIQRLLYRTVVPGRFIVSPMQQPGGGVGRAEFC